MPQLVTANNSAISILVPDTQYRPPKLLAKGKVIEVTFLAQEDTYYWLDKSHCIVKLIGDKDRREVRGHSKNSQTNFAKNRPRRFPCAISDIVFCISQKDMPFSPYFCCVVQILHVNGTGTSISADWIGRDLYWTEQEAPDRCVVKSYDLYKDDGHIKTLVRRANMIEKLALNPYKRYSVQVSF